MKGGNVAGLLLAYQACLLIIIIKALTDLQIGMISWIPPDLPSLLAIIRRMFSVYAMYHCILMHPTCINLHPACISLIQFILSRFLVKINPSAWLGVFQIVRLLLACSGPQFATHRPVSAALLEFFFLACCLASPPCSYFTHSTHYVFKTLSNGWMLTTS